MAKNGLRTVHVPKQNPGYNIQTGGEGVRAFEALPNLNLKNFQTFQTMIEQNSATFPKLYLGVF